MNTTYNNLAFLTWPVSIHDFFTLFWHKNAPLLTVQLAEVALPSNLEAIVTTVTTVTTVTVTSVTVATVTVTTVTVTTVTSLLSLL